jgi:hypothetical protein
MLFYARNPVRIILNCQLLCRKSIIFVCFFFSLRKSDLSQKFKLLCFKQKKTVWPNRHKCLNKIKEIPFELNKQEFPISAIYSFLYLIQRGFTFLVLFKKVWFLWVSRIQSCALWKKIAPIRIIKLRNPKIWGIITNGPSGNFPRYIKNCLISYEA